jgi:hypothetical protein
MENLKVENRIAKEIRITSRAGEAPNCTDQTPGNFQTPTFNLTFKIA